MGVVVVVVYTYGYLVLSCFDIYNRINRIRINDNKYQAIAYVVCIV